MLIGVKSVRTFRACSPAPTLRATFPVRPVGRCCQPPTPITKRWRSAQVRRWAIPQNGQGLPPPPSPPSGHGGSGGSGGWEDDNDDGKWLLWAVLTLAAIPFAKEFLDKIFSMQGGVSVLSMDTIPGQSRPVFAAVGVQGAAVVKTITPQPMQRSAGKGREAVVAILAALCLFAGGTYVLGKRKKRSAKPAQDDAIMEGQWAPSIGTEEHHMALYRQVPLTEESNGEGGDDDLMLDAPLSTTVRSRALDASMFQNLAGHEEKEQEADTPVVEMKDREDERVRNNSSDFNNDRVEQYTSEHYHSSPKLPEVQHSEPEIVPIDSSETDRHTALIETDPKENSIIADLVQESAPSQDSLQFCEILESPDVQSHPVGDDILTEDGLLGTKREVPCNLEESDSQSYLIFGMQTKQAFFGMKPDVSEQLGESEDRSCLRMDDMLKKEAFFGTHEDTFEHAQQLDVQVYPEIDGMQTKDAFFGTGQEVTECLEEADAKAHLVIDGVKNKDMLFGTHDDAIEQLEDMEAELDALNRDLESEEVLNTKYVVEEPEEATEGEVHPLSADVHNKDGSFESEKEATEILEHSDAEAHLVIDDVQTKDAFAVTEHDSEDLEETEADLEPTVDSVVNKDANFEIEEVNEESTEELEETKAEEHPVVLGVEDEDAILESEDVDVQSEETKAHLLPAVDSDLEEKAPEDNAQDLPEHPEQPHEEQDPVVDCPEQAPTVSITEPEAPKHKEPVCVVTEIEPIPEEPVQDTPQDHLESVDSVPVRDDSPKAPLNAVADLTEEVEDFVVTPTATNELVTPTESEVLPVKDKEGGNTDDQIEDDWGIVSKVEVKEPAAPPMMTRSPPGGGSDKSPVTEEDVILEVPKPADPGHLAPKKEAIKTKGKKDKKEVPPAIDTKQSAMSAESPKEGSSDASPTGKDKKGKGKKKKGKKRRPGKGRAF